MFNLTVTERSLAFRAEELYAEGNIKMAAYQIANLCNGWETKCTDVAKLTGMDATTLYKLKKIGSSFAQWPEWFEASLPQNLEILYAASLHSFASLLEAALAGDFDTRKQEHVVPALNARRKKPSFQLLTAEAIFAETVDQVEKPQP